MKAYEMISVCPFCQYGFDLASSVKGGQKAPGDGDLTICIRCGEFAVFESKAPGGLRKPTDTEYVTIGQDDFCQKMRAAWTRAGPQIQAAMKAGKTPIYETIDTGRVPGGNKSPMRDMGLQEGFDALLEARFGKKPPPEPLYEAFREWYFLGCCRIMDHMHTIRTMEDKKAVALMDALQEECAEFAQSMLGKMNRRKPGDEPSKH